MAGRLNLQALQRAALMSDDGEAYTPTSTPLMAGAQIRAWGYDQALKKRFADGVAATKNPNALNMHASPLPTEWETMGQVVRGRRNAIEAAGGTARIADPLRSRPARTMASGRDAGEGDGPMSYAVQNQAGYGSGADAAIERKRRELTLASLDNAASRERIEGVDLDGSGRRAVERGRAIADERHELENVAPQRQRLTNSVNALARAATRDEWGKDFAAKAPEREYSDTQYQKRYVEPAAIRANAAVRSAELGGASKERVADITGDSRVDAARLAALARQVQELTRAGQTDAAAIRSDAIEPLDPVGQAITEIRKRKADATPEEILFMLGDDLTPAERATAERILGGA